MADERTERTLERLLDGAGAAFAEHGPRRARMEHVARAAGSSRATLYRHFATREALEQAYVAREATRIGARIAERVAVLDAPEERLVEAVRCALEEVRARPVLEAWFSPEAAGSTARMAIASQAVREIAARFVTDLLGDADGLSPVPPAGGAATLARDDATAWLMRVVLSLLTLPAGDPAEEERLLRSFLVPSLLAGA